MANNQEKSKYRHKISEHKRLYSTLQTMKARCNRKTHAKYQYYGARGIKVCDEWMNPETGFDTFADWALSHGYTDEMTIERIDVNGNYCPENCKWITAGEQAKNKSTTLWVDYNGEHIQFSELCKRYGANYDMVHDRYYHIGMNLDDALSLPKQNISEFALKCRKYGIKPKIVKDRIRKLGWDEERALTTPARVCKRKNEE